MSGATGGSGLPAGYSALGYAGLLPFVACVIGVATLDGDARDWAARALLAYGAVILSFLGAVHWGIGLVSSAARSARFALAAVLPSVVAWIALLLPVRYGITLLVVGFGGFWLYEHRVLGPDALPTAYLRLRRYLTIAVCSLLALGLIALG